MCPPVSPASLNKPFLITVEIGKKKGKGQGLKMGKDNAAKVSETQGFLGPKWGTLSATNPVALVPDLSIRKAVLCLLRSGTSAAPLDS